MLSRMQELVRLQVAKSITYCDKNNVGSQHITIKGDKSNFEDGTSFKLTIFNYFGEPTHLIFIFGRPRELRIEVVNLKKFVLLRLDPMSPYLKVKNIKKRRRMKPIFFGKETTKSYSFMNEALYKMVCH